MRANIEKDNLSRRSGLFFLPALQIIDVLYKLTGITNRRMGFGF